MKFRLCCVIVTLAAASYGFGFGNALKAVNKAKEKVQSVDNAVNGTKTTDSSPTGATADQPAQTEDAPAGAPAPSNKTPASVDKSSVSAYDMRKRQLIQSQCESKLDDAGRKFHIDYGSSREIRNWLSANSTTIVDADTEASYRAKFDEKLNAAKIAAMQESALVECQAKLSNARTCREIGESSYSEIEKWLKDNRSTVVDDDTMKSYRTKLDEKLNAAKIELEQAMFASRRESELAQLQSSLDEAQSLQEIDESSYSEIEKWLKDNRSTVVDDDTLESYSAALWSKLDAAKKEHAVQREEWGNRRRKLYYDCDQKLRRAKLDGEIGDEGDEIDRWCEVEIAKINDGEDESRFKAEFKKKYDAAHVKMEQRRKLQQLISTCYQACISAVEDAELSYDGKANRKAAVDKFFNGGATGSSVTLEAAERYKEELTKELDGLGALPASTDEAALRGAVANEDLDSELRNNIAKQLVSITTDMQLLMSFYDGALQGVIKYDDRWIVPSRLAELADGISDTDVVLSLLEGDGVTDQVKREKLLSRLSNAKLVSYVIGALGHCGIQSWNENKILPFDDAIVALKSAKDEEAVKIVSCVLMKFSKYEEECKDSWVMSWGDGDMAKVKNIVDRFPKFDDATIERFICADDTSWLYITNCLTANVAYNVLAAGKAKSDKLEVALTAFLPPEKIDMKVYNGARFVSSKKSLFDRMTPTMKECVANAEKSAYMDICIKAKSEAKSTFELYGFYIGMPFDDVKTVLSYHFPNAKIREGVDGTGESADHVIYIDGQKSPFCFARTSDKKVWQFNFGKKLLEKWYDFDTQTYAEWAAAYGDKTKSDMRFKLVEKKTTVYELDMSDSYDVWFHQESYQYKNNKKKYLLIYFGEERDYTFESGIGGDIIKSMAAKDFRYVKGDPGSLRVMVVRDE